MNQPSPPDDPDKEKRRPPVSPPTHSDGAHSRLGHSQAVNQRGEMICLSIAPFGLKLSGAVVGQIHKTMS